MAVHLACRRAADRTAAAVGIAAGLEADTKEAVGMVAAAVSVLMDQTRQRNPKAAPV